MSQKARSELVRRCEKLGISFVTDVLLQKEIEGDAINRAGLPARIEYLLNSCGETWVEEYVAGYEAVMGKGEIPE